MKEYRDILVLGVGNILLGDEGIGVHVVRELEKEKLSGNVELMDAGTALFSVVHLLKKRKKVIVIDAAKGGEEPGTINKAMDFIVAADTKKRLKRTRIGLIGYASMMVYTGTFDHLFLRKIIGPEIVHIDNYTFINEAKKVSPSNYQKVIEHLRQKAKIADEVTPQQLIKVSRMYIALKSLLCNKSQLKAVNAKYQYELSREYGMVASGAAGR